MMKHFGFTLLLVLIALSITVDASAQRKKKKKSKGDVEVIIPCSGPEYMTNDKFIRATGISISSDMNVAKKKSMASARSEIAMAIETTVKSVTDTYVSSYQFGEEDDTKQEFKEMTRQSAKQTLKGVRIICDKLMRTPDGKYRAYVTLELAGNELLESMAGAVQNDEKLKLDFEYEKFKEIFDEEMNNYSNGN